MDKVMLEAIARELPEYFPLTEISKYTKGIIGKSHFSNLVYSGIGPAVHKVGRKRFIVKSEFVKWMDMYFNGMEVVRNGSGNSGNGTTICLSERAKEAIRAERERIEGSGGRVEAGDTSGDVC